MSNDRRTRPRLAAEAHPGLLWTLLVLAAWTVLAGVRPATTWHLAPLLLAAAWPWVVGQDSSPGEVSARARTVRAGGAGLLSALATSGALSLTGRLDGPTWTGSGTALTEALVLSVLGAVLATTAGLLRTARRSRTVTARVAFGNGIEVEAGVDTPGAPGTPEGPR